jgi:hypothetical protein
VVGRRGSGEAARAMNVDTQMPEERFVSGTVGYVANGMGDILSPVDGHGAKDAMLAVSHLTRSQETGTERSP